jgi:hypothetical protein
LELEAEIKSQLEKLKLDPTASPKTQEERTTNSDGSTTAMVTSSRHCTAVHARVLLPVENHPTGRMIWMWRIYPK